MYLAIALVISGFAMQLLAWIFYRRDYPKFWVSRPVLYFLYPKGVALVIVGVVAAVVGLVVYSGSQ